MPYFMRKEDGKFCVYKGTKEKPEKQMHCYDAAEDANDYLKALMANAGHSPQKSVDEGPVPDSPTEPVASMGMTVGPTADWENMTAEQIMETVGKDVNSVGDEPEVDEQKAEMTGASRNNLPDSAFLYIEPGGKKDDGGKTIPRSKRHLPYRTASGEIDKAHLRNAISRLSQSATGKVEGESWLTEDLRKRLLAKARKLLGSSGDSSDDEKSVESKFTVYKSGDVYRWLAIANVAMWDREDERLTDKAYDDATEYAEQVGYPQLDLVHVEGTDVGDCNLVRRMGKGEEAHLVMGGTWYDDPRSIRARKSVESRPDYFGTSIKFVYDPAQFVDGEYLGGIRIKKCTVLPRRMAASHGTAIAVLGGEQKMKELDKETKEALVDLGYDEKEIEELAERSKSLPEEPNTVTKENEPLLTQIRTLINKAFGKEAPEPEATQPDVAEQSETKKTETEVEPVDQAQENEETEKADTETTESPDPVETVPSESVKAIAQVVAESLAPSIKETLQPLAESLASIKQWQATIEKRISETEKDIETKVVEKLAEQPPIVKVRTTELKQAEEPDQPALPTGTKSNFNKELMESVKGIVSQAMKGYLDMPEVKLPE